jgi:hypothetical protein
MVTISGSNWVPPQKGTPARTVNKLSAYFPKSILYMCVIKRGTTNTLGHQGWASLSSHRSSIATSIAGGGSSHSLTASTSLSSNMLS